MRLPLPPRAAPTLDRQQLLRTLCAAAAGGLTAFTPARAALAATYTVVPTGSVAAKQARLKAVEKKFAKDPDDPYAFGEKAQLEYDIGALRRNRDYASALSRDVADGKTLWNQGLTIAVPDMAAAVAFWKGGMGALVLDTRLIGGANVTRVGFGPQSLGAEDGAKFALELVETRGSGAAPMADSLLQYVQLAMPVFRISQVLAFGGEIQSAYGWTELTAPGGLQLRVRIDETRRDPFEFVALRTSDLRSAVGHYVALGMVAVEEKSGRRTLSVTKYSTTLFEDSDAMEPDREAGATLMSFGDKALSTGVLLLPPKSRRGAVRPGSPAPSLRLIGAPPAAAAASSPDGLANAFTPAAAFEAGLRLARRA